MGSEGKFYCDHSYLPASVKSFNKRELSSISYSFYQHLQSPPILVMFRRTRLRFPSVHAPRAFRHDH